MMSLQSPLQNSVSDSKKMPAVFLFGLTGSGKTTMSNIFSERMLSLLPDELVEIIRPAVTIKVLDKNDYPLLDVYGDDTLLVLPEWIDMGEIEKISQQRPISAIVIAVPYAMAYGRLARRKSKKYRRVALTQMFHFREDGYSDILLFLANLGAKTFILDGRDMPHNIISVNDIEKIARWDLDSKLTAGDYVPEEWYQQFFRYVEKTFGTKNQERQEFEIRRWDSILPQNMDGLSVIDLGCNRGSFCVESINRGGDFAIGVDNDENCLRFLKYLRDAWEIPVSTITFDLNSDLTGIIASESKWPRFDLCLMLNILHRVMCPEKMLIQAMSFAKKIIAEIPFRAVEWDSNSNSYLDENPSKPQWSQYVDTWHFSPMWINQIVNSHGFHICNIMPQSHSPHQRLLFTIEKDDLK